MDGLEFENGLLVKWHGQRPEYMDGHSLLAREHGYGIENMTLTWLTRGLGQPAVARAIYAPDVIETQTLDGDTRTTGL